MGGRAAGGRRQVRGLRAGAPRSAGAEPLGSPLSGGFSAPGRLAASPGGGWRMVGGGSLSARRGWGAAGPRR